MTSLEYLLVSIAATGGVLVAFLMGASLVASLDDLRIPRRFRHALGFPPLPPLSNKELPSLFAIRDDAAKLDDVRFAPYVQALDNAIATTSDRDLHIVHAARLLLKRRLRERH